MTPQTFLSNSEADTRAFAARLVATLAPGAVLLLSGDLGAGKTAFVRGLAEGLGVDPADVTSPTFTLVHEYRGGRLPLMHVDLYRLDTADLDEIGMDVDLANQGIVAVEWPERLVRRMPGAWRVAIADLSGTVRAISVDDSPPASAKSVLDETP